MTFDLKTYINCPKSNQLNLFNNQSSLLSITIYNGNHDISKPAFALNEIQRCNVKINNLKLYIACSLNYRVQSIFTFQKKYVLFSLRPFNFVTGYTDILNINLTIGEKVRMFDQKRLSSSFDGVVYENYFICYD
jgi:hypothetical protein